MKVINRRGFISALCAAMAAPDPDKLLWQPGAKLISVPSGHKLINIDSWSIAFKRARTADPFRYYSTFCLLGGGCYPPHPLLKTNKDAMEYARQYRKFYHPEHKYVNVIAYNNSGEKYVGEIYA